MGGSDAADQPVSDGGTDRATGEEDLAESVASFLEAFETVCEEYDRGYMDADAALERVRASAADLEAAFEAVDR